MALTDKTSTDYAGTFPNGHEKLASAWLVPTKFVPPQDHVSIVSRPELLDRLDRHLDRRLSLIHASAGFGKTTLMAQWRQRLLENDANVAWLTLDEDDVEPKYFLSYLILAMHRGGVDVGALAQAALTGLKEVPASSAIAGLITSIASIEEKVVLALDDYHRVDCPEIGDILDALIAQMPSNLHLIIAGRERPNIPLAELHLRGELNQINAGDLSFSISHARRLLPPSLEYDEVKALIYRTEGWAAALQLVRMWLQENAERRLQMDAFGAATSNMADYLAEQVFNDLSPDLQQFLLKTSVLEKLTGSLADAVCGLTDSWARLEELTRACSFLLPVDEQRHWYRYHHLFAEFLQEQLNRSQVDVNALHLSASEWYAAHGSLDDAVRHARLAGDLDRAARIVLDAGGWELVFVEGPAKVRTLLRNFGPGIARYPRLQLCEVYVLMKNGDVRGARQLFDAISASTGKFQLDAGIEDPELYRDGAMVGILLAGYEDHLSDQEHRALMKHLVADTSPVDHSAQACINCVLCLQHIALAQFSELEQAAHRVAGEMRRGGSDPGLMYACFHLGLSYLLRGDLLRAADAYRSGQDLAVEHFGADSGPKAIADVLLAEVLYLRNEVDEASDHLHGSLLYVEDYDGWIDIYLSGYHTGIDLACCGRHMEAAVGLLERGEITARKRTLPRLQRFMDACRLRMMLQFGDLEDAARQAQHIEKTFRVGGWRQDAALWREECEFGNVLAELALLKGFTAPALGLLREVQECCRAIDSRYYLVPTLVRTAVACNLQGDRVSAVRRIVEALDLSADAGLKRPFLDLAPPLWDSVKSLLQETMAEADQESWRPFAQQLFEELSGARTDIGRPTLASLFTERELAVLLQLVQGYPNKVIARALNISENTVKFHLKNIYAKLGVDRRARAVKVARERCLIR